jgi:hypothetical protein
MLPSTNCARTRCTDGTWRRGAFRLKLEKRQRYWFLSPPVKRQVIRRRSAALGQQLDEFFELPVQFLRSQYHDNVFWFFLAAAPNPKRYVVAVLGVVAEFAPGAVATDFSRWLDEYVLIELSEAVAQVEGPGVSV